jgi:hypothetical protein
LRRRIVLAVIFLAAFIVLLRLAVLAGEFDRDRLRSGA